MLLLALYNLNDMYYIIQENTFNEKGHDRLIKTLNRFELSYEIVKVKPFIEEFKFKTDRKDVFCFGGLKMARLAPQYEWKPGVLMTPNHNFLVYRNYYQDELLNFDSKVYQFGEDFGWSQGVYFIRPTEDTKSFSGQVFDIISWTKFRQDALDGSYHSQLTKDTLIQVSSIKRIQKEFRFWIVDGEIVTGSQYKMGRRPYFNSEVDPAAIKYCQRMINKFQLAEAFVIDVCLTNGRWRIVECGCLNCAGFYEADMQKLIIALEEKFK
jgi:hypothetical protein